MGLYSFNHFLPLELSSGWHWPLLESHSVPLGQQLILSGQQTAFIRGQHPNRPDCRSQHVDRSSHKVPSGHRTVIWARFCWSGTRGLLAVRAVSQKTDCPLVALSHDMASKLQIVFSGQQWRPSLQQTARSMGQQPHCPVGNLQQVVLSGQVDFLSGHCTSQNPRQIHAKIIVKQEIPCILPQKSSVGQLSWMRTFKQESSLWQEIFKC